MILALFGRYSPLAFLKSRLSSSPRDRQRKRLYPDLVRYGSLGKLLRAELRRIGSPLTATGFDESINGSPYWASVRTENQSSDVTIAISERLFTAPLWRGGVQHASVDTASVEVLARALHAWFIDKRSAGDMGRAFSEVTVAPIAAVYEAGPREYVEFRWQGLLEGLERTMPDLYPLARLAYGSPVFRQLLPYTSLNRLCFSRCTGFPFTDDYPIFGPMADGEFYILSPAEEKLGQGTAEAVLQIALANLPPNYGPAVHGTAEEPDFKYL